MNSISFVVYGEPVAQGRPRATTANGHVRMYDPTKSRDYKQYVKLAAMQHKPKEIMQGALLVRIDVYKQIPKSMSKKKEALALAGEIRPITKPDVDNYAKGIKDALKGVIWRDDSQVVDLAVSKWYGTPRIEITTIEIGRV